MYTLVPKYMFKQFIIKKPRHNKILGIKRELENLTLNSILGYFCCTDPTKGPSYRQDWWLCFVKHEMSHSNEPNILCIYFRSQAPKEGWDWNLAFENDHRIRSAVQLSQIIQVVFSNILKIISNFHCIKFCKFGTKYLQTSYESMICIGPPKEIWSEPAITNMPRFSLLCHQIGSVFFFFFFISLQFLNPPRHSKKKSLTGLWE